MYRFSTKGIRSKRIHIDANGLRIPLLILKPLSEPENAPGVMWIHGGGYYHAFDMSEPEHPTGKEAIKNFNEMFAYAKEHYFAKQE